MKLFWKFCVTFSEFSILRNVDELLVKIRILITVWSMKASVGEFVLFELLEFFQSFVQDVIITD